MKCLLAAIAGSLALSACAGVSSPTPGSASEPVSATAPALAACGDEAPAPGAPVYAFFTCADDDAAPPWETYPVPRTAQAADALGRLEAALTGLVAGPTDAEAALGYTSFFSAQTAGSLNRVELEPNGFAIVDLGDVRPFMGTASTSTGMQVFLSQLNATVFQVEEVTAVEYRIDGSCQTFWEWLQSICNVVPRP